MRVGEFRRLLEGVPPEAVVQIHVECRRTEDGAIIMHGVPVTRVEFDGEVPGLGPDGGPGSVLEIS